MMLLGLAWKRLRTSRGWVEVLSQWIDDMVTAYEDWWTWADIGMEHFAPEPG
jgi:hypothetical protein